MKELIKVSIYLAVIGVAAGCASYESQSSACDGFNANACFEAAGQVWNLRASSLKPCSADASLCIRKGESREQAMTRLRNKAIEQNAIACDRGNNAEACTRAGSGLAIMGINMHEGEYRKIAARAEFFFDKACILGSRSGCMLKGTTHRAGK